METKTCSRCKSVHPSTAKYFNKDKSRKDGLSYICKTCSGVVVAKKSVAKWRSLHPQGRLKWDVIGRRRLKIQTFEAYGGAFCQCCGETSLEFLSLDHINGDGAKQRRLEGHRGGAPAYRLLRKKGFPPGYRVLCLNCNFALGHFGYCPHDKEFYDVIHMNPNSIGV